MVQSSFFSPSLIANVRHNSVTCGAFFLTVMMWAGICLISRKPGSTALLQFLFCAAVMMLCSAVVLWHCNKTSQKIAFRWIFITALILRLMSLLGDPLFEDDYFRYLWDGFQTATTNDPYSLAPSVFFDRDVPEIFEPILSLINYPDIATVYGPVSEWFFALGYLIAPAEIWPLQLLASIADMVVLCVLFKMGAGNALLLYAWSPLLLKEFSLTAHPDIYAILFMVLSCWAVYLNRALLAGAALALACGSKVFAILVLPYLLTRGWSFRNWGMFGLAFAASLIAITACFGSITIWVPEGLMAMADSWLFNAPLYLMLLNVLPFQTIKLLLLSLFLVYGLITAWRRLTSLAQSTSTNGWIHTPAAFRGDWLYALFLLCLPVVNPWYVAWLLPFAVLTPRYWSWTASYAVLLSYWYGINTDNAGTEQLSAIVVAIEYGLIVALPVLVFIASVFVTKGVSDKKYCRW